FLGSQQRAHDWIAADNINFYVNTGDFYGTGHPGFPTSASVFVDSKWSIVS
ncbi:unnamed protein product, partial [marine sediment metagenome]